jgi:hypothetical protein
VYQPQNRCLAELAAVWPNEERPPELMPLRIRGFSKLKTQLDEASGVSGWRWHDLRRTARTGMARLGVPRDHAEAVRMIATTMRTRSSPRRCGGSSTSQAW